ncbi:hypothetical protein ACWGJ2_16865 [Streptomyces sp. NPDC054796]
MAVLPYAEVSHLAGLGHLGNAHWVVYLRPVGGGREWTTVPEAVTWP